MCRAKRTLFSKKYGVDLIHFIHGTEQVLHGSTKVDGKALPCRDRVDSSDVSCRCRSTIAIGGQQVHTILFRSHETVKFILRCRSLHSCSSSFSSVVSLSICPTEETFLTSSIDNTLRLWDVRIPTAQVRHGIIFHSPHNGRSLQGFLNTQPTTGPASRPVANFDPEGTSTLHPG